MDSGFYTWRSVCKTNLTSRTISRTIWQICRPPATRNVLLNWRTPHRRCCAPGNLRPTGSHANSADRPHCLAPLISGYGLDLGQGNPHQTGSPLDLMIAGNGYFTVRNGIRPC